MVEKITGWAESVNNLTRISRKYLHSEYAGLQKSLHQEWAFVQRVTPGIGDTFGPVEKALREAFMPELFKGLGDGAPGRWVTCLPVKQAVLALPDPNQTAPENHRCELPGNYPVFTVVMVIYTFVRRISIITLPSNFF